jgi:hypothetical protein
MGRIGLALLCLGLQGCAGFSDAYRDNAAATASYDRFRLSALCNWELNGGTAHICGAGLDSQGR